MPCFCGAGGCPLPACPLIIPSLPRLPDGVGRSKLLASCAHRSIPSRCLSRHPARLQEVQRCGALNPAPMLIPTRTDPDASLALSSGPTAPKHNPRGGWMKAETQGAATPGISPSPLITQWILSLLGRAFGGHYPPAVWHRASPPAAWCTSFCICRLD